MVLTIFITSIIVVVLALTYDYCRCKNRTKQILKQFNSNNSQIKELREEISMLRSKLQYTFEDPVTKLLGWQLFEDRIKQNIKESERYHFTMGVMFVDIDNFKMINDAISYEVGDKLLLEVANRLNGCLRQVDSISRLAKDTFVILLAQLAKPETAAIVGQRILQALSQPFQINDHEIYITACIGIALYPADGQDVPSLLRNVDHALHVAKESGKHVCQFYQADMHTQSQRDLAIYNSLSRESIFDELVIYYQPIINANNDKVFCMDAALCWQNAELGLINTQELYDYAEKQRKLNALSLWLLKGACKEFLTWRQAGLKLNLLGLPLSIKQLENSSFIYELSHILQEMDFNPEWLVVEIKESNLHESLETIEKAFNMLHYLGIKITIDDFASGSFTLRYLKNVTVDYLKLDKSFTEDIAQNEQTRALVKSILFLADTLNIHVISQGVENEQQMAVFKELGCVLMMGSLLGRPLTSVEVIKSVTVPTA